MPCKEKYNCTSYMLFDSCNNCSAAKKAVEHNRRTTDSFIAAVEDLIKQEGL